MLLQNVLLHHVKTAELQASFVRQWDQLGAEVARIHHVLHPVLLCRLRKLLKPLQSVVASTAVSDTLIDSLQVSVELAAVSNVRQQEVHERFEDMLVAIDELGDFFGALRFWKVVLCSGVSFLVVVWAGASLGECFFNHNFIIVDTETVC
jgi:hypothetical protein